MKYSKLIGTVIGAIVGVVFAYLANKGLGSCDASGVCTILGFSETQVSTFLVGLFAAIGTERAPRNVP